MTWLMAVLLVALPCSVAFSTPAAATEGALDVSQDGVTWVDSITDPLFDSDVRWIPGESRTGSFFIRHRGGTPGHLVVDVIGSASGGLLDSGDLHVSARGGGGTWREISTAGTHRLLTVPDLPSGAIEKIVVTVAFDQRSTNATQQSAAHLLFRVTLTESSATDGPGEEHDGGGNGPLPDTGAPDAWWLAVTAAVLIATGLLLVASSRAGDDDV